MKPVVPYLGHVLAWPALYSAIFFAVVLCLLAVAASVAIFAQDDKRANRAYKIFSDLLRTLRWRSR